MDAMPEQWRPVPDWEGLYEVSDLGQVRSLDRRVPVKDSLGVWRLRLHRGRILTGWLRHGYPTIVLSRGRTASGGEKRDVGIHILVLEAFRGPRPPGQEACHGPGGCADARLVNLRWNTKEANEADKRRDGTQHNVNKTHCSRGHEYTPENTRIRHQKNRPNPGRLCIKCNRDYQRAWMRQHRAEDRRHG